jgi:hypothetical protein
VKFFHQTREALEFVAAFAVDRARPLAALARAAADARGLPADAELWLVHETPAGPARRLDAARSADEQAIGNGAVVVCQHPPGRDPGPAPPPRAPAAREVGAPVAYRDVFPDERPETVEEFLSAAANMSDVELFDIDRPSDAALAVVHVSASLSFVKLKRMIARLFALDYAPDRDAMLLFRVTNQKTRATTQMDTVMHATLRAYFSSAQQGKRHQFLFQVLEGVSEEVMAHSSRYTVHFARDGVHVEKDAKVLAPKKSTCREIFERLGVECDSAHLRYARVYDHKIDQTLDASGTLVNLLFALRVDVVPESQRNRAEYKYLLPVSFGFLQIGSFVTRAKGYPFFFPVLEGEPFKDTKQRLIAAIGWDSGDGVKYRFLEGKFGADAEIADDAVLAEIGGEQSQLFVISPEDAKQVHRKLNALQNAPVRIYN